MDTVGRTLAGGGTGKLADELDMNIFDNISCCLFCAPKKIYLINTEVEGSTLSAISNIPVAIETISTHRPAVACYSSAGEVIL